VKSTFDCLPCLCRNVVKAATLLFKDEEERHSYISKSMHLLADTDLRQPPPYHFCKFADLMAEGRDNADPFIEEKIRSSELAEKLLPELIKAGLYNPDDFESRMRLAIAGNILDFGVYCDLDISQALESVKSAFSAPLDAGRIAALKSRMDNAKSIFYTLDNCGEAVFDREFMAPYRDKVVLAVRGKPTLNDVTRNDLAISGLENFTHKVVDNGSRMPGVQEELAPEEFRREFNRADIIIAKGQGNFETLSETDRPIAFLFLSKCIVVQRYLNTGDKALQLQLKNF